MSVDTAVLQEVFVAAMVVAIMLAVGLDLTLERVAAVFRRPRVLVLGLLVNFVLVPLVGWAVVVALDLSPGVAAGLLLCAAAPGGPIGMLLVVHARGDLALAISLIVVMTLASTVTTPFTLTLMEVAPPGAESPLSLWAVAQSIGLYQLFPLTLGMAVRRARPHLADRALPVVTLGSKLVLGVTFIGLSVVQGQHLMSFGWLSLLGVELCVVASLALGSLLPPGAPSVRSAVSLSTGVRNVALAILIATVWFDDADTILTTMIYGLLMLVTGVPFSHWWRRRTR